MCIHNPLLASRQLLVKRKARTSSIQKYSRPVISAYAKSVQGFSAFYCQQFPTFSLFFCIEMFSVVQLSSYYYRKSGIVVSTVKSLGRCAASVENRCVIFFFFFSLSLVSHFVSEFLPERRLKACNKISHRQWFWPFTYHCTKFYRSQLLSTIWAIPSFFTCPY